MEDPDINQHILATLLLKDAKSTYLRKTTTTNHESRSFSDKMALGSWARASRRLGQGPIPHPAQKSTPKQAKHEHGLRLRPSREKSSSKRRGQGLPEWDPRCSGDKQIGPHVSTGHLHTKEAANQ